jgi:hypothetical protein
MNKTLNKEKKIEMVELFEATLRDYFEGKITGKTNNLEKLLMKLKNVHDYAMGYDMTSTNTPPSETNYCIHDWIRGVSDMSLSQIESAICSKCGVVYSKDSTNYPIK